MDANLRFQLDHLDAPLRRQGRHGLFRLPVEIRQRIYNHCLKPSCRLTDPEKLCSLDPNHFHIWRNALGCTEVLVPCKQSYHEAINLLHHDYIVVHVRANPGQAFRYPRAFGKPSFFRTWKPTYMCAIGPRFSELQMMRLRKIELALDLPEFPNHDIINSIDVTSLEKKLREIAGMVWKPTHLSSLKITFARAGDPNDDRN
jgi:hypothetical protein